jgi:hypothetical protein
MKNTIIKYNFNFAVSPPWSIESTCPFFLGHPTRPIYYKKELNQLIIHLYCYHHEEIFKLIRLYTKVDYKTEVLSGLTVA